MKKEFAERLDDLIDDYLSMTSDDNRRLILDEIQSALELKLAAFREGDVT